MAPRRQPSLGMTGLQCPYFSMQLPHRHLVALKVNGQGVHVSERASLSRALIVDARAITLALGTAHAALRSGDAGAHVTQLRTQARRLA